MGAERDIPTSSTVPTPKILTRIDKPTEWPNWIAVADSETEMKRRDFDRQGRTKHSARGEAHHRQQDGDAQIPD